MNCAVYLQGSRITSFHMYYLDPHAQLQEFLFTEKWHLLLVGLPIPASSDLLVNRQTLVPLSKVKNTKLQLKMVVNSTKISKTKVRSKADTKCSMWFGDLSLYEWNLSLSLLLTLVTARVSYKLFNAWQTVSIGLSIILALFLKIWNPHLYGEETLFLPYILSVVIYHTLFSSSSSTFFPAVYIVFF